VVVQTAARQLLARIRVRKMRESQLGESQKQRNAEYRQPQSLLSAPPTRRGNPTNADRDMSKLMFDLAAIRIQAAFRGWWARDCITVDNYCACIIQKNYRRYRCWETYLLNCYRIVKVQSVVRRKLAHDRAGTLLYCIVVIQAAFRGYVVRKRMGPQRARILSPDRSATIIQSQWRSFSSEMNFLRSYEDVLVVQSIARGWITRRLIRSWLRAHKIQTSSRLLGQPTHLQRSSSYSYDLPRNFFNHTEFIRNRLPVSGRPPHAEGPAGNQKVGGAAADSTESTAPTEQNSHQDGVTSRAARTFIESRRREKELTKKAILEDEKRRESEATAHAFQMKERRRRMGKKAQEREKQDLEATAITPVVSRQEHTLSKSRNSFDEEFHRRKWIAHTNSAESQPNKSTAVVQREQKDPQPVGERMNSILKSNLPKEVSSRTPGASRVLAGWRDREKSNSFDQQNLDQKNPARQWKTSQNARPNQTAGRTNQINGLRSSSSWDERTPSWKATKAGSDDSTKAAQAKEEPIPKEDLASSIADDRSVSQRNERIMNSFGLGVAQSFDDGSSASSEEGEASSHVQSKPSRGFSDANADAQPFKPQAATSHLARQAAPKRQPKPAPKSLEVSEVETVAPTTQSTIALRIALRGKRNDSEQRRIDEMHAIFLRVGLMGGGRRISKKCISASETTHNEANTKDSMAPQGKKGENLQADAAEPSASDLIRAWRNRDQTQPKMLGKLF
jgi:hypothetical protein